MEDIYEELECVTVELHRYQNMTQQLLDYVIQHQDIKEVKEIYSIIREWCC